MNSNDIYDIQKDNQLETIMSKDSVLFEYPQGKIVLVDLFLGGAIGGFLLYFYIGLRDGNLRISLTGITLFMFFLAFVGVIPVFITGAIIA